jgi:hypothetical protein
VGLFIFEEEEVVSKGALAFSGIGVEYLTKLNGLQD